MSLVLPIQLRIYNPLTDGPHDQLGFLVDAELFHQIEFVSVDCFAA